MARRNRAALAVWISISAATLPYPASAQEFLNPNVGGCGMGTNKTVVDRQVGGRGIQLPADGTVGTITFADDAIADGTLDAEITGSCLQEGNKVAVFAKGRVVNRAAFTSNTQASAGFSLNMRPHAKPFNTDYLLRAAGNFAVTWDRGTPGALGGASAGFSLTNCDPGGDKSLGAGAGPAAQGVAVSSGTVECRRRSGNPFGFLESDVPISFGASVHQFAGAPQEFSFEGAVVFELLRVGKEIRVVSGPTRGSAGTPFPEPFVVLVANNGSGAPVPGESVQFRLLDSSGAAVQTTGATTAGDGKASANFTPPAGGIYKVEAVCAGCPASSQELGQGSKVVFPPVSAEARRSFVSLVKDTEDDPAAGDGQRAYVGNYLSPFRVRLQSGGAGHPQEGVAVRFSIAAPPGALGAWVLPETAVTDASGRASTVLTLGSEPGDYVVRAVCSACTGEREVTFTARALPIPTFEAGFLSDFFEGPSVAIEPNRDANALLPDISAEITATGDPPGLPFAWEIVRGADKVRFAGATDGPTVSLSPLAPSVNKDDIEVVVRYGRGVLTRKARATQRLTVQSPTRIDYAKDPPVDCAKLFSKGLPLPGLPKEGAKGPNGRLVGFQGTILDQFGRPFAIPANKSLSVGEDGVTVRVEHATPGLPFTEGTRDILFIPVSARGTITDLIGFCAGVEYPLNFRATFDRCVKAKDLRIQREIATYTGFDAEIGLSEEPGCR